MLSLNLTTIYNKADQQESPTFFYGGQNLRYRAASRQIFCRWEYGGNDMEDTQDLYLIINILKIIKTNLFSKH